MAVLTAVVVTALWWAGTRGLDGKDLVTARLDALKTGLSIGVGGGGLFALYLAWRRQRSTEADLDNRERTLAHQLVVAAKTEAHQERVAAATERDAEARRITDLYTKAVEQLGSEKAPVRLGGLYALERLAQDHAEQRQTIVNVLCAYLRMPYDLPEQAPEPGADKDLLLEHRERIQEREVRLTAQRLLATHLRPGPDENTPAATFWIDIDIDLTGATLIDLELDACTIRAARFSEAIFTGITRFNGATFTHTAWFNGATFTHTAWFNGATFTHTARFNRATFTDTAWFKEAIFTHTAWFTGVTFADIAWFNGVTFTDAAWFEGATFTHTAGFNGVTFTGIAWFEGTTFTSNASFDGATFTDDTAFDAVTFTGDARFTGATLPDARYVDDTTPSPWTSFVGARFERGVRAEVERFVSAPEKETEDDTETW
ncbi:pentapeptide repeat-containing protein [Actinokineospora sp. PR83]|uniref:pentapeptide repeat-containing protein n=1 Tax=Actinokineospora sp. PR83 TaxID=2884908 RepID=UPI0027E18FDD|nr:pentapeptide repeat-containing protein [Actinokineospora sp. PR83]MCG8919424.1 pentapeptide repeat-containing protein [Actinokineospora sp. PR83]